MRKKSADAWAHGGTDPRLRGSLHPPPGRLKFSTLPEIPRATLRAGFFPHGRFGGRMAGRSGGSQGEGQGAAGAQREGAKRCGNAAGIESHGIDQKPERQESARTGDRCASALAFFVFRLVTRPLCRFSPFLPFPSDLRALPRRPGHEPELPPCLRRRLALDARGIDVDAVGWHGPIRTHSPDAHGGVRAAAGLILLRRPWLPCEGRRVRRVSQEDQHGKEKDTRRDCRKGRRQSGTDERRSDGADRSGAAHHGSH